jgi:ATP-dependent DNA ligase
VSIELDAWREGAHANGIEGLMPKRADSFYVPGPWFKGSATG